MVVLNGFVALIDILGFQSFVRRDDFEGRAQRYLDSLADIIDKSPSPILYYQASDSTILTTEGAGLEALRSLMEAVSAISYSAIVSQELAIRGGLASGTYAVQDAGPSGSLVTGPAVVDAYSSEQQQDWVGTMLAPSVFHTVPDLVDLLTPPALPNNPGEARQFEARMLWLSVATRYSQIPLHSQTPLHDPTLDGFMILPKQSVTETPEDLVQDLRSIERTLERLALFAPDEASQRKYSRSRIFLRSEMTRWGRIGSLAAWANRNQRI